MRYDNDMVKQVAASVTSSTQRLKEMLVAAAAWHIFELCEKSAPDSDFNYALSASSHGPESPEEVARAAIAETLRGSPVLANAIKAVGLWDDEVRDDEDVFSRAAHMICVEALPRAASLWDEREHSYS